MYAYDLTPKFRKQLDDAVALWSCGDEADMIALIYTVQADGFAEGCNYTRDRVAEFLKIGGGDSSNG